MTHHNNTWTIIRKEFARFFGDRQLVFTSVIMPGLLIYLIYTLMGNAIQQMVSEGANDIVTLQVENMPASLAPAIASVDSNLVVIGKAFGQEEIAQLEDKDINVVLMRFPEDFDAVVTAYDPQGDLPPSNVEIYYNSTNNASARIYGLLSTVLGNWGRAFTVNVPQSEEQRFDQATDESIGAMVWSKIIPMLIIMMLFSGTMAIAPSAIAGEKERGTFATLLVTPMKRSELALGKIVSLSAIALLSGISSFIGIALSLPNMIAPGSDGVDIPFHYTTSDYIALLLVILASVLVMSSAVSLLSALAKDVKNAGTMITPFMLVIMLAGLLPMFQSEPPQSLVVYLIPFYNAIEVMTAVFSHTLDWTAVSVTLASNVVYTGIAVWGLTRMFNSEKIMFSR